ncbi:MAG: hypothetical protein IKB87_01440 [Clostridia bacterium]|nr:hypothetical protein [Clostridia bacterium]
MIARTQNLGFRLRVSNRRYTFAKTLSDAYASEWFFVIIKTKESHTADAVWLSLGRNADLDAKAVSG